MNRLVPFASFVLPFLAPHVAAQTAPYEATYDAVSDSSSFNAEVVRGMAKSGTDLFAIHCYQSSLMRFNLAAIGSGTGNFEADGRWPTLADPVAISVYGGGVYVLGQGSHALARHDSTTGEITDVFKPNDFSEPADLVIDERNGEAYVSCMGSDCVVRIELDGKMSEIERWTSEKVAGAPHFRLKRPRFLFWNGAQLFVAPFLSGNNTLVVFDGDMSPQDDIDNHTGLAVNAVHDGYDAAVFPQGGLPDVDLFRIQPSTGAVDAILRRAGSLLTAHGINPDDQQYWMLGIDSLNTSADTEPALRGQFARNTVAITPRGALPAPGAGNAAVEVTSIVDVDLEPPYDAADSLPFPYAVEFGGPAGRVAVASSTLSRVALMDGQGARVGLIEHDGRVARDLLFDGDLLYIYCQQTSDIVVWGVPGGTPNNTETRSLLLGADPTPDAIAHGRDLFYDAEQSAHARLTCATCHPGGESDVLVWPLKNGVVDFKDPMMTQPLKGLRETFPYHWRGERDLDDFNGAFEGLLGSDRSLTQQEFFDFEAFIFSLRPAANPREHIDRVLTSVLKEVHDTSTSTLTGNAIKGQENFNATTCTQCHAQPTGSAGSPFKDSNSGSHSFAAWNSNIETIQLSNFLQPRDQAMVDVTVRNAMADVTTPRPLLGGGFLHNGGDNNLHFFVHRRFLGALGNGTAKDVADTAAFILELDTGTPPAAHHAIVLDASHAGAEQEVQDVLIAQASDAKGWIDLVVHGVAPNDAGFLQSLHWVFENGLFVSDDPLNAPTPRPLSHFTDFATHPTMRNTFVGVLPGLGQRLGVDFDGDGIVNGNEPGQEWDPAPPPANDTQAPALAVGTGVEPILARATHAEFTFTADEPVRWLLRATATAGGHSVSAYGSAFGRQHTAHLHDLKPSTNGSPTVYEATLTMWDRAGNSPAVPIAFTFTAGVTLGGFGPGNERVVIGDLRFLGDPVRTPDPANPGEYVLTGTVRAEVQDYDDPTNDPVQDWVVIGQLVKRPANDLDWEVVDTSDLEHTAPNDPSLGGSDGFTVDGGDDYPTTDPPYVVMLATNANGRTTVSIQVSGISLTDEVAYNVVAVVPVPATYMPATPDFPMKVGGSFPLWLMPRTPAAKRMIIDD